MSALSEKRRGKEIAIEGSRKNETRGGLGHYVLVGAVAFPAKSREVGQADRPQPQFGTRKDPPINFMLT